LAYIFFLTLQLFNIAMQLTLYTFAEIYRNSVLLAIRLFTMVI